LDKTGTITSGNLEVTDVVTNKGVAIKEVLAMAASVEMGSEHPIGEAIVKAAKNAKSQIPKASQFQAIPGLGARAKINNQDITLGSLKLVQQNKIPLGYFEKTANKFQTEGKTIMFLIFGQQVGAVIALIDNIKPEVKGLVSYLKSKNIEPVMITGDNRNTAEAIAAKAGINKIFANVLPQDKVFEIENLQSQGKSVAMAGDGINDAPALAQADVGIAMGSGTDVTIETGDIVLIGGSMSGIATLFELGRQTLKTIRQNLFWAFIYNILLIPIAAGMLYFLFSDGTVPRALSFLLGKYGFLNPILAAGAMAFSSLAVVLNSLRLNSFKPFKTGSFQ
jgi:Cu+-exporting ATPase